MGEVEEGMSTQGRGTLSGDNCVAVTGLGVLTRMAFKGVVSELCAGLLFETRL